MLSRDQCTGTSPGERGSQVPVPSGTDCHNEGQAPATPTPFSINLAAHAVLPLLGLSSTWKLAHTCTWRKAAAAHPTLLQGPGIASARGVVLAPPENPGPGAGSSSAARAGPSPFQTHKPGLQRRRTGQGVQGICRTKACPGCNQSWHLLPIVTCLGFTAVFCRKVNATTNGKSFKESQIRQKQVETKCPDHVRGGGPLPFLGINVCRGLCEHFHTLLYLNLPTLLRGGTTPTWCCWVRALRHRAPEETGCSGML